MLVTHIDEEKHLVGKLGPTVDAEMGAMCEIEGPSKVTHTPPPNTLPHRAATLEVRTDPRTAPVVRAEQE